ncbi:cytochrome P450 [Lentzea sp. JNUCC 0626]|uniref:cytochrome P450 n=1 Tax=Lentzea sp. JNUCC 0626 TaxID=3367513 RepID=UPI00374818F9
MTGLHTLLATEFDTTLRWLLEQPGPVRDDETGAWFVGRHAQVRAALTDTRFLGRSTEHATAGFDDAQRATVSELEDHLSRWLVFSDAPAQDLLREKLRRAMRGSARAAELPARFAALAGAAAGTVGADLFSGFVVPYTSAAVMTVLGAPAEDAERVTGWGVDVLGYLGMGRFDAGVVDRARAGLRGLTEYCLGDYRRTASGLLAEVVRTGADDADLVAVFTQVLTGALEPTRTVLAEALATVADPGALSGFRAAPSVFTDEMVRLCSPFHFASRRASVEIELGGQVIGGGDRVRLVLPAANRDPQVFPVPERVDIGRAPRRHVAFGWGKHVCTGAWLAEQITVAGVEAMTDPSRGLPAQLHCDRVRTPGMTVATGLRPASN